MPNAKQQIRELKPSFHAIYNGERFGRYKGQPSTVAKKIVKEMLIDNDDDYEKVNKVRYVEFAPNDYGRSDKVYRYNFNVQPSNRVMRFGNKEIPLKWDYKVWKA